MLTGTEGPDEMRASPATTRSAASAATTCSPAASADDSVFGGGGDDTLFAGNGGDDFLDGGHRRGHAWRAAPEATPTWSTTPGDVVVEAAAAGNDTSGRRSTYRLPANVENLELTGTAVKGAGNGLDNEIRGNGKNNVLNGGAGDDGIFAGAGRDRVSGGAGDDRLYGGKGNDKVFGGTGDDTIAGILGRDVMEGGTGEDGSSSCRRRTPASARDRDVIRDFAHGTRPDRPAQGRRRQRPARQPGAGVHRRRSGSPARPGSSGRRGTCWPRISTATGRRTSRSGSGASARRTRSDFIV